MDTLEKDLHNKWVGQAVRVVKFDTYGTKDVALDDTGIVVRIESYNDKEVTLAVDILPVKDWEGRKGWLCLTTDIEIISSKEVLDIKMLPTINGYMAFYKNRVKSYKDSYSATLNELRMIGEQSYLLRNKLRDINVLIRNINSTSGRMNKGTIANEVKLVLDRYTDISYVNGFNMLSATTKPIILSFKSESGIDRGDGKIHKIEMGVYKVTIDITKPNIRFAWVSCVNPKYPGISDIHPHIEESGVACWGTWEQPVHERLVDGDYLQVLLLAHDFLCSCDPYGWYVNAFAFDKDAVKKCTRCWQLKDTCECGRCSECHKLIEEDCECDRCGNTGDLIEDRSEYCKECGHLNSDGTCGY